MLCGLGLGAYPCWPNVVGNDTQRFNPITSGLSFVTVQSSEVLDYGYLNSGLFFNHAGNVLPHSVDASGYQVSSDNTMLFGDLSFGFGVGHNLDLGISFSYLVDHHSDFETPGAQFAKNGLNEIRISTKYNIIERKPIGIAVVSSANFNQVRNNPFIGEDSGPTKNIEVVFDTLIKPMTHLALNMGYRFRENGKPIEGSLYKPLSDISIASLGLSHYFPRWDLKTVMEIISSLSQNSSSKENGSEFIAGFKYDWSQSLSVHTGAGGRLSPGLFTPDWRIYTGINISFDLLSQKSADKLTNPEAVIFNQISKNETKIYKGFIPEDIQKLSEVDFDLMRRMVDFDLTRSIPRSDDLNPKPPFEVLRLDGFEFDFGSSVIKPRYYEMMNNLADYLKSNPPVIKLRVEGHTDSLGSEEKNKARSQSRADEIKKYLEKKGVTTKYPLQSIGFGSDRPIGDNSSAQGRTKNRRVEIRVLRQINSPDLQLKEEEE